MAEDGSREEKVLAGLKRLKQFQRINRRGAKKKEFTGSSFGPDGSLSQSKEDTKEQVTINNTHASRSSKDHTAGSPLHIRASEREECAGSDAGPQIQQWEPEQEQHASPFHYFAEEISSTESLRQMTQRIDGLMSENRVFLNGEEAGTTATSGPVDSLELERRNRELAATLEGHRQTNEQLQFQLQEMQARISRMQREFEKERDDLREKAHKEQVILKDQLQVHIQTIGILVAEKTELQSSLSQSQQTAKQKAAEVEELQGRLRGSRQRVTDLERELTSVSNSNHHYVKSSKEYSKDVDRLKLELYKSGKSNEELKQQNCELLEKFNEKLSECKTLEATLTDVRSRLSMSELCVEQLKNSNPAEAARQLEDLQLEKFDLENKLKEQKESFLKLTSERDQMADQYQAYVQQLTQQATSLRDELKELTDEREIPLKEVAELQEKIQSLEQALDATSSRVLEPEGSEDLNEKLQSVETELENLKRRYDAQVSDNAQMSHLIAGQDVQIEELKSTLTRLQDEQVNKEQLLESMQSDKVAASRAVAQNRDLKKQLEELQDVFVRMSNDKLCLTEKLDHEQHVTKELGERLGQQEDELQECRDQLILKGQQIRELQKSSSKDLFQQHQIADQMRHYEAQGQLVEMLQQELMQSQERINSLVTQNADLHASLARQATEATAATENGQEDKDSLKKNDLVASLSASVRQLEMERDQMLRQLEDQQIQRETLQHQIREMKGSHAVGGETERTVSPEDYRSLKEAQRQLEARFKRTMDQIADLSEQKQQLEHLVTQLQGETETIGDYIALYQVQRNIMRERAAEKDMYIAQLATDREDLKSKLQELQTLVVRMLEERKHRDTSASGNSVPLPGRAAIETDRTSKIENASEVEETSPDRSGRDIRVKIMNLLSEIGTSSLVETPVPDNFHPCPLCSGRLLTV